MKKISSTPSFTIHWKNIDERSFYVFSIFIDNTLLKVAGVNISSCSLFENANNNEFFDKGLSAHIFCIAKDHFKWKEKCWIKELWFPTYICAVHLLFSFQQFAGLSSSYLSWVGIIRLYVQFHVWKTLHHITGR